MTDHRLDRWARRLAEPDSELIHSHRGRGSAEGESVFDGVARTLAAPVTRRRAVGLIGGAAVAVSLLRPRRARADCYPGGPQTCTAAGGAKVCVPADYTCCSNDKCAIACRSYQGCESAGICGDTAKLCNTPRGREEGGISDAFRTKFCHAVLPKTGSRTCGQPDSVMATFGWCCRPNDDCVLLADNAYGSCNCPPDDQGRGPRDCGEQCCPKGQICVSTGNFISSQQHCKPPCIKGRHYDGDGNCVCDSGSACGLNGCCPEGKVCQGTRCVSPTETSDRFKDFSNSFKGFFGGDSGGQSAGSSGGGSYLKLGRGRMPSGRAAAGPGSTPVRSALLLLAAVNAQGAAAALAINDPTADRSFRRRVVAAKPKLPK